MGRGYYFISRHHHGSTVQLYMTSRGRRVFERECISPDEYAAALDDLRKFICGLHLFQAASVNELFTVKLNRVTSFDEIPYGSIIKLMTE